MSGMLQSMKLDIPYMYGMKLTENISDPTKLILNMKLFTVKDTVNIYGDIVV